MSNQKINRSDWSDGSRAGEASMLATILGPIATRADAADLAAALEAYHQGTERGELRALLVRVGMLREHFVVGFEHRGVARALLGAALLGHV